MNKILIRILLTLLCILITTPLYRAQASTDVSTDIVVNTEWTTAGSPYVIKNNISVFSGSTLNIDPGVIIKFEYWTSVSIEDGAILNSKGTFASNVYVTSLANDNRGGDTNGDGVGSEPYEGDYIGIIFKPLAKGSIKNTEFSYSDIPIHVDYVSQLDNSNNAFKNNYYNGIGLFGDTYGLNVDITSKDPYILFNDIYISNDHRLNVSPGANLSSVYGNEINIWNSKNFSMLGSSSDHIIFYNVPVVISNNSSAIITYADFLNYTIYNSPLTIYDNSNATLDNILIKDIVSANQSVVIFNNSSLTISNSLIDNTNDGIVLFNNSKLYGDHLNIYNSLGSGIISFGNSYYENNLVRLRFSEIAYSYYGLTIGNYTNTDISKNNIHNNTYGATTWNMYNIDLKNNYWGDESGPYNVENNVNGLGNEVFDYIDFVPFLSSNPLDEALCTIDCNSSVLFLPGVTGSRLYEDNTPATSPGCVANASGLCTFKRWLPLTDSDVRRLYLNAAGSSLNTIYTKDIIDTAIGVSNIYKSFLDDLDSWKNTESIIADYSAIPYDWRFSARQIITQGRKDSLGKISYENFLFPGETPYVVSELLRLASTSRTGKVTIIAHSNGGLVAKELMLKLRELGKEDLVDQLIFVAVPHVGTPDAMKVLLHGTDIGPWGLISDSKLTREFVKNMSTAYDILPSRKYFDTGGSGLSLATFDDSSYFNNARNHYGFGISNFSEFDNYVKNVEGRTTPLYADLNHAGTLNTTLLDNSDILHARLDAWEPTANTKVIEVAGWGEYTLGSIGYRTEKDCTSHGFIRTGILFTYTCLSYEDKQVLDVVDTLEGDGTVVERSAHYLSDKNTLNTEKWWVDLESYNDPLFGVNRKHPDILEISDLLNFIKNKAINLVSSYTYISQIKPTSSKKLTKIKLNSPLTLNLYDSAGNHTGLNSSGQIEENIPGSRYRTVGDSKYVLVPQDITTNLKLKGYEEGSFSLNVDTLQGDTISSSTTFSAIPSSASTIVTMDLPANTDPTISTPLKIDFNGDGTIDTQIIPKPNGEVIYDITPPELKVTFNLNTKDVVFSAIDTLDPNPLITTTNSSITLHDVSANTTVIPFTKYREGPTKLKFSYNKVIRNDIITILPDTNIVYDWQEKKGFLTDLDTKVTIKGIEKYIFSYKKSTNMTTIKIKTNSGFTITTRQGFVPVTLINNNLSVSY